MTDIRTAAEMALDTLDAISESGIYYKENPFDAYMRLRSMARGAIEALRQAIAQDEQEHFCDSHCVHTDHHPDCELAQPEQEPVAWNNDVEQMPLNTYCKAIVNWWSYDTDGDSTKEGEEVEVIVVKYERNKNENSFVFLHTGDNQYLHTKVKIIKWYPLYATPISEPVKVQTGEPVENLEPVLWIKDGVIGRSNVPEGYTGVLYTAPLKRVWQGLTDEDWHNLPSSDKKGCERDAEIFNWIEDKLKEKNT